MNLNKFALSNIIILFFLGYCNNLLPQTEAEINEQVYNKFQEYTDRINCEIQKALLEVKGYDLSEIICKKLDDATLRTILDNKNVSKNIEIHDAIIHKRNELLNNINVGDALRRINTFREYIFDELPLLKNSSLATEAPEKLDFLKNQTVGPIINGFRNELQDLKEQVVTDEKTTSEVERTLDRDQSELVNKKSNGSFLGSLMTFFTIISFLLICGLCYYVLILNKKINHINDKRRYLKSQFDILRLEIEKPNTSRRESDNIKSKIRTLEQILDQLQDEIRDVRGDTSKTQHSAIGSKDVRMDELLKKDQVKSPDILVNEDQLRSQELKVSSPKSIVFYLANADPKGGFFWDHQKSDTDSKHLKFELEIDPNNSKRGFFSITRDESRHKTLIDSYDLYLEPVCEIRGNKGGSKVEQIKSGVVELQADKWQIIKKCIIKIT